jgi:Domain of unknown function (DUF1877)
MTAGLYRASETEIGTLIADPASVAAFIDGATWAPPLRDVRPKGMLGWLMKLSPITIQEVDPDAVPPPGYDQENDRPHCDLEKMWHGLHFLFTGTAWEGEEPACFLLKGGEPVGETEELGYSVLQTLSAAKTRQFAGFLGSLSRDYLEHGYDPKRMMALEIYPEIWDRGGPEDQTPLENLLAAYDDLQAFIDAAAQAGDGAIVYVT